MRFLKLALLVGGLVVLSSTADAQEAWRTGPSVTGALTPDPLCDRGVSPGATCFFTFHNVATDSPVLNIQAEYARVYFNPNIASTNDTGATIEVMAVTGAACSGYSASDNTSEPITNGTLAVLTGATATNSNGTSVIADHGCIWIDIESTTTQDSMVKVVGAPVGRQ